MKDKAGIINEKVLLYAIGYLFSLGIFIYGVLKLFDFSSVLDTYTSNAEIEFYSSFEIMLNNMKNLISYIVLFPVFPILLAMDFIATGISIAISINIQGLGKTLLLIAPHGIVEIPNFIFYSYLSGTLFFDIYKNKNSLKGYWQKIFENKKYYVVSILIVVFAGIVEGQLTPVIYNIFDKFL